MRKEFSQRDNRITKNFQPNSGQSKVNSGGIIGIEKIFYKKKVGRYIFTGFRGAQI